MSKHTERKVENPDDEFGIAPGESSVIGAEAGGEKGKEKEEGNGLDFLDYVTCSIW
jgi:hypothetical protein